MISLTMTTPPDMRKSLSKDPEKKAMIPLAKPVHPNDLEDF